LSLLENNKVFLDILFGEPSSKKSSESKCKGSNGSVKGESSVDHEDDGNDDEEEAPSKKKDKLASERKRQSSSKSKRIPRKMRVRNGRYRKEEGTPKRKKSPNLRASSLICDTRAAPERPSLPVASPAVLYRVAITISIKCAHGVSFHLTIKWSFQRLQQGFVLSSFRCA
jgi:hypothetical protein